MRAIKPYTNPQKAATMRKEQIAFFLYVLPAMVVFILFKYWPIVFSAVLSFFKWDFVGSMKWVGLKNFVAMFTRESFQLAARNTLLYILGLFPFFVIFPLVFAVALTNLRGRFAQSFYKALIFIPTILAFSIICLVWMWMFNPNFGLLNNFSLMLGGRRIAWLAERNTALLSIVLVTGWKVIGSNFILYVAGLVMVPRDYIEAAIIDGASRWKTFWNIKWPLLAPTTIYILVTAINYASEKAFTPINILTKGGPADVSTNLSHIIYVYGFTFFNIGLASATAIFTSVFFFIITKAMMKAAGGFGYYEN
ncbi:MAG: carbohydrate ABC transporter permease [Sphaerochaetaceae bacterium]